MILSLLVGIVLIGLGMALWQKRSTGTQGLRMAKLAGSILLMLGGGSLIIGSIVSMFTSNYAFNEVFDELKEKQRQGLVQEISGHEFEQAIKNGCVLIKKEEDTIEDSDDMKVEKVESKEGFRWMRHGRYRRGRWRGYPYHRYWRYPYSRFIRYPYYARGPARWVVYDGDYYYVTV